MVDYYKPAGIPLRHLREELLTLEEFEALRLRYTLGYDQVKSAALMHVSQSTLQRTLQVAHQKLATAILNGYALRIARTAPDAVYWPKR